MDNIFCQYSQAVYALYMNMSFGIEICSRGDLAALSRALYKEEYKEQCKQDKDLVCSTTTLYS